MSTPYSLCIDISAVRKLGRVMTCRGILAIKGPCKQCSYMRGVSGFGHEAVHSLAAANGSCLL